MDYKIKFEYQGMGKQVAVARQRALQVSKKAIGGTSSSSSARESISSLRTLNSSINKLINSNKELTNAIKRSSGLGGGGSPRSSLKLGGGSAGFGGIGASIPILGAAIATVGFTIQKINQVGNAYIEKASQQIGNVGIGRFQRGRGVYTGSQMGAGMKSYGMATGKFLQKGAKPNKTALDVGAIYGLSAEETLRTAGQFKRAGASYKEAVFGGAGAGIQAELPTLLTGMAGIFTDAVREGINTSSMSKDMAQQISAIALKTPSKSIEAALNIVKSFQGIQKQISGGKIGSAQGLYATKAAQSMLMERLTGEGGADYRSKLLKQGFISEKQATAMSGLKKGAGFEELLQNAPSVAMPLLRKFTAESSPAELQKRTIGLVKKSFGDTPEGRQRFYDFATSQGWAENQSQLETLMGVGEGGFDMKKGQKIIKQKAKGVEQSAAGMAVKRVQQRESMLFDFGASFAKQSLAIEKSMLNLARKAAPMATSAIESLGDAAMKAAQGLNEIKGNYNKIKNKMSKITPGASGAEVLYELVTN